MHLKNKVLLASGSPRRRELCAYLFNIVEVIKTDLNEPAWQIGQKPEHYLRLCIEAKWLAAKTALERRGPQADEKEALVLVADTIVVLGREVLGKPADAAAAFKALQKLSGKAHQVLTAYAVGRLRDVNGQSYIEKVVSSEVQFRSLSAAEIKNYIRSKEPMDKAGSYGFQEKGVQLIRTLKGSYTNVVGLPLEDLRQSVQELLADGVV